MLLTFKVKHAFDFSEHLRKAMLVAQFGITHHSRTSKDVAHIGLKSAISNQILKKYGGNKKAKRATRVNLTIPGQAVKQLGTTIRIPCLGVAFDFTPHRSTGKVKQIEANADTFFVTCEVMEAPFVPQSKWIGVDLNTTGHCAVLANPSTGKVLKMGKSAGHIRSQYRAIRRNAQKNRKLRLLKKIKNREQRKLVALEHRISKKIVSTALASGCGIRMENLTGIRGRAKTSRSFRAPLHSWSFARLQSFVEYKAKLRGVPLELIDPAFTSQADSKTGLLGNRNGKLFISPNGRVENADVNAAFNLALASLDVSRLRSDRDARKRSLKPAKVQCL